MTVSKVNLANDQCFESFMGEFSAFFIHKKCVKNVLSNVVLSFKGDAEKFYLRFINVFQMQKFFWWIFKQAWFIAVGI